MRFGPAGGGRGGYTQRTKEIPPDKTSGEDETMNEPLKKKIPKVEARVASRPHRGSRSLPCWTGPPVRAPYEVVVDLETHGYYNRKSEKSTLL